MPFGRRLLLEQGCFALQLRRQPSRALVQRCQSIDVAPQRFVTRLEAVRHAYAPLGETTEVGLGATFRVLQSASPWPVGLTLAPKDLREPPFLTSARARLGPTPPPP